MNHVSNKKTFDKKANLLEKIIKLADENHNGDVVGNMRFIFEKLSTYEKSVLLDDWASQHFIVKPLYSENDSTDDEVNDIDKFNQQEMVKLKIWMAKAITLIVIGSAGLIFILSTTAEKAISGIESAFKILGVMLK